MSLHFILSDYISYDMLLTLVLSSYYKYTKKYAISQIYKIGIVFRVVLCYHMIAIKEWHPAKPEKVKHMSAKKLEVIIEAILNHTKMIVFPTTCEAYVRS